MIIKILGREVFATGGDAKAPELEPWVSRVGVESPFGGYIIASSMSPVPLIDTSFKGVSDLTVRQAAGIKESIIDGKQTYKVGSADIAKNGDGWILPDDFNQYEEYLDAFRFVPKVARALEVKTLYMLQAGFDIEHDNPDIVKDTEDKLAEFNADEKFKEITLWAQVFGNYYYRRDKAGDWVPVSPMRVAAKVDPENPSKVIKYGIKVSKTVNRFDEVKPADMLHFVINPDPWSIFGHGVLIRVLDTVKKILYMEKYLPEIARHRADPWISFKISDPRTGQPLPGPEHDKIEKSLKSRKPGENIYHAGEVEATEVYQAAGVGGRQSIEGLLKVFTDDLHAGLGVPEVLLASGSTTLTGTAEVQDVGFESEIRGLMRSLKRFAESRLFPLLKINMESRLVWRPLKEEDKNALSTRLANEYRLGIITRGYYQQLMGYPSTEEQPKDGEDDKHEAPQNPSNDPAQSQDEEEPKGEEEPGKEETFVNPDGTIRDPLFDYLVDNNPCDTCLANKDGSPYKESEIATRFPNAVKIAPDLYEVNQHKNCKCTLKRRYEPDEPPRPIYVDGKDAEPSGVGPMGNN